MEAVAAEIAEVHRYPDFASRALIAGLAERFDVPEAHLNVGTGSVALVQQLMQITTLPGDSVVFGWRAFESYPIMTGIQGATARKIPLDSADRHDLPAMLEAIDSTTRIVYVCNPNNPTSTAVDEASLRDFVESVPPDVVVVIDEAYREFVDPGAIPDGVSFYRSHSNVAVLRTFSKAYGLAGLRIGFCIAQDEISAALRKVQLPFGVSSVAQAAAVAALDHETEMIQRVAMIREERTRIDAGLRAIGFSPAESEANFLWLRLGEKTMSFAEACEVAGLAVRPFPGEGVRITIGEPAANSRLLEIAQEWVRRS
jgi:histidinol-phosphate aminotransferase